MHRTDIAPIHARFPLGGSIGSLARRWYYTPRSHRAYSVRQISPGDRRLLAEFALALTQSTPDRELAGVRQLTDVLFDRVISRAATRRWDSLRSSPPGRAIVSSERWRYAPTSRENADFCIAVAHTHREEQVGRTLLADACCVMRDASACRNSRPKCTGRTGPCRCWPCRWDSPSSRWREIARCGASCSRSSNSSHQSFREVECPIPSQASRCKTTPAR